jgi:hypothetical protein
VARTAQLRPDRAQAMEAVAKAQAQIDKGDLKAKEDLPRLLRRRQEIEEKIKIELKHPEHERHEAEKTMTVPGATPGAPGEPGTHAPRFPRFAQRSVHVLGHYAALV